MDRAAELTSLDPQLHLTDWALPLARECDRAAQHIAISALSCLPPRGAGHSQWEQLWRAWTAAAARGVVVDLYLPSPTPHHGATIQNRNVAAVAAAAGVRPHLIPGAQLLHCKSVVIDARAVWIGSGNFTAAACHHNHEAWLRVDHAEFAARLLARWEKIQWS